jgi:glutamyl-tRNA reductase
MVVGELQILDPSVALEKDHRHEKSISVAGERDKDMRMPFHQFHAVELAKNIHRPAESPSCFWEQEKWLSWRQSMMSFGVKSVTVANRTFERGCELAAEFNGRAIAFEDFLKEMIHSDIIFCSTGAPTYVLHKEEMQRVMKERKQRPVFIIDISVPRNIDPAINDLDNVYLYDVDDLRGVVDSNIMERQKEAKKAEDIVEEEIPDKAESIKREELGRLMNKLPDLEEKERKAIEYMATAITNKLIHPSTIALKDDVEDKDALIAAVRKLYALNGNDEEKNE